MQKSYLNFNSTFETQDLLLSAKWLLSESVFTSLALKDGINHAIELHFERLNQNLKKSYAVELNNEFRTKIKNLIGEFAKFPNLKLRVEFFRKDVNSLVKNFSDLSHLITISDFPIMTLEQKAISLSSTLIEKNIDEFSSIKTSEYASSQFRKLKTGQDFLYQKNGQIIEASSSALGLVLNNKLIIPKFFGQLFSVSLNYLVNNIADRIKVEISEISIEMLKDSQEIILINSVRGIIPVKSFGDFPKNAWQERNSITQKIATMYEEVFYN